MALGNPHAIDASRQGRREAGKSLRHQTPRKSHATWTPAPNRADPLALLQAQDKGRLQHLLPIKYGRMLASPFAFLRGSAVIMAADLAGSPITGLETILCGDAHLSNFGLFATPERELVFDINDFDESFPGPWEWDLKRLAASIVVAGRDAANDFGDKTNRNVVINMVEVYRNAMQRFAAMHTLDVWYYFVEAESLEGFFDKNSSKKARKLIEKMVDKARTRTQEQTLAKLTTIGEDGRRHINHEPPLLVHIHEDNLTQIFDGADLGQLAESSVNNTWQQYLSSLPEEKRFLLSRFRPVDAALRVGGVGSVGTRCLIVLVEGGADDDALILQLKEAGPSVLESYVPKRTDISPAKRVVLGQKMMQTTSDIFLGWHKSQITGHDFYWRQLKDMKGSVDVTKMDKAGFNSYAEVCGLCLARAHARTGDAASIAGYLGKSNTFDKAIGDFALAYADQSALDYAALVTAVDSGQIVAMPGI